MPRQPRNPERSERATRSLWSTLAARLGLTVGDGEGPVGRGWRIVICIALALAVWCVFSQTLGHEFVNYDDDIYVYHNALVTQGATGPNLARAFTQVNVDEWWPLTTASHILNHHFFGLNPAGHHLTNVLLHTATVLLLFLALRTLTGALWRSAFVAAVFAIHPLRVESVAWVTERKDVLSGCFFMLTLWAYGRYAQRRAGEPLRKRAGGQRGDSHLPTFSLSHFRCFYLLALAFFTLGLLSKTMLITVPFVLLLLDYWPLNRMPRVKCQVSGADTRLDNLTPRTSHIALFVEKVPFLLLGVAAGLVTLLVVGGTHSREELPIAWRVGNALTACAVYLGQMLYPVGLAVFYPHPEDSLSLGTVGLSALILSCISVAVAAGWRKRPYLIVGWLWYLVMLVPVIGLVQVGSQAHADRYTYLPQIGLYLMLAWGAADLFAAWRHRRVALATGAVAVLVVLGVVAHGQTRHWRDSHSLWTRALACTSGNYLAHNNFGNLLAAQGQWDEAIFHYEQALELKPGYAEASYNLAVVLADQGKLDEAIRLYKRAIQIKPGYAAAHNNLGNALARQGKLDLAIHHAERAVELSPDSPEARYNLANKLATTGRTDEAIGHYQSAIRLNPDYAAAHKQLAARLSNQQEWPRAVHHYARALDLSPGDAVVHNNLGKALAAQGNMREAVAHFERALRLKPDYAVAHANLGHAFSAQGELARAVEYLQEALRLATEQANPSLAETILNRLESLGFSLDPSEAP